MRLPPPRLVVWIALAFAGVSPLRGGDARAETAAPGASQPAQAEPKPGSTTPPGSPRPLPASEKRRTEFGLVPLVGGDTDVGIGVGQLSTIAALPPPSSRFPYRWAIESSAFISFTRETGKIISPYQDYYVQWTAPALLGGRLRLEARPSFTRESTQRYYGLGNASVAPAHDVPSRDFYGRTHPMLWVRARYRFWDQLQAGFGSYYLQNWLSVPAGGTLAQQMATGDATVRRLLGGTANHGVLVLEGLLLYDSRDSEIVTDSGQFHQIKLRVSPRFGPSVPYSYQQINVTSRFFFAAIPNRLVLAVRYLADIQLGNPPFYELARYDDTYALGGGNGVRGVPGQRYYGKVKAFASAEARMRVGSFDLHHKHMTVGVAGFFDAGRAWAELASHPELDGTGIGLKYGVGAGLRVQEGKTFVVRGDIAWSPDARPIGGYVTAGQAF